MTTRPVSRVAGFMTALARHNARYDGGTLKAVEGWDEAARPFGQIGAVSFQPMDSDREDLTVEFAAYGDLLGLFAHKFIATYVKAMDKQQWIPADICLSKREIECLRWAARCKTAQDIAASSAVR